MSKHTNTFAKEAILQEAERLRDVYMIVDEATLYETTRCVYADATEFQRHAFDLLEQELVVPPTPTPKERPPTNTDVTSAMDVWVQSIRHRYGVRHVKYRTGPKNYRVFVSRDETADDGHTICFVDRNTGEISQSLWQRRDHGPTLSGSVLEIDKKEINEDV